MELHHRTHVAKIGIYSCAGPELPLRTAGVDPVNASAAEQRRALLDASPVTHANVEPAEGVRIEPGAGPEVFGPSRSILPVPPVLHALPPLADVHRHLQSGVAVPARWRARGARRLHAVVRVQGADVDDSTWSWTCRTRCWAARRRCRTPRCRCRGWSGTTLPHPSRCSTPRRVTCTSGRDAANTKCRWPGTTTTARRIRSRCRSAERPVAAPSPGPVLPPLRSVVRSPSSSASLRLGRQPHRAQHDHAVSCSGLPLHFPFSEVLGAYAPRVGLFSQGPGRVTDNRRRPVRRDRSRRRRLDCQEPIHLLYAMLGQRAHGLGQAAPHCMDGLRCSLVDMETFANRAVTVRCVVIRRWVLQDTPQGAFLAPDSSTRTASRNSMMCAALMGFTSAATTASA